MIDQVALAISFSRHFCITARSQLVLNMLQIVIDEFGEFALKVFELLLHMRQFSVGHVVEVYHFCACAANRAQQFVEL